MNSLEPISWYIEYHAKQNPGNICIACEDRMYTYKEVYLIICYIANLLCHKGVISNSVIGIYAERSELIPLYILAINKAGAAYVPLHEDFPKERLAHIIKNSQINGIITDNDKNFLEIAENNVWTLAISIERINEIKKEEIHEHDDLRPTPISNRAAIYYTSGSSGKPKGVVHTNESIMTSNLSECQALKLTSNDKTLLVTHWTICFSITSFESLIVGGALYIATKEMCMNLNLLHQYAEDKTISIIHMPSQIGFQYSQLFPNSRIRLLYVGGSPFQTIKEKVSYDIINVYGSTEGMALSFSKCTSGLHIASLGHPLNHTKWTVVDEQRNVVTKGTVGELLVSSKCIALGYLNLDQLTHQRFFSFHGLKTFATNDLVKENDDGSFTYVGRKDVMLKIRGLRIEPEEIVFNILKHKSIRQACVCKKIINDIDYLCAYYVREKNAGSLTEQELSNYLRASLPDSMIPNFFVELNALPLNNRGKIDYDLLPYPNNTNHASINNELTSKEKTLLSIIEDTINTTDIDINDNFFSIGGDSLSALLVAARLQSEGYRLSVNLMKECKSIKDLANRMTSNGFNLDINEQGNSVKHSYLLRYVVANNKRQDVNQFIIEDFIKSQARIKISILHETLRVLVTYHEILNASYINNYLVFKKKDLDLSIINEFTIDDDNSNYKEIFEELMNSFYCSFDIAHALFKVMLIHFNKYDIVVLGAHHMISDAISKRNIVKDFCYIYDNLLRNIKPSVIYYTKPLSYKAYQELIHDFYNSGIANKEKLYWDTVRNGLPKPILEELHHTNKFSLITSVIGTISGSKILRLVLRYKKGLLSIVTLAVYKAISCIYHVKTTAFQIFLHGRNDQFIGTEKTLYNESPFFLGSSVGCFVVNPPIIINGNYSDKTTELLSDVDNLLNNMPNGGVGFDATGGYPDNLIPSFGIDMVGIRDTLYPKDIYSKDFERCKGLPHGQPVSNHLNMGCPYIIYVGISKGNLFLKTRYNQAYISDSHAKLILNRIIIEIKQVIKLLEADL